MAQELGPNDPQTTDLTSGPTSVYVTPTRTDDSSSATPQGLREALTGIGEFEYDPNETTISDTSLEGIEGRGVPTREVMMFLPQQETAPPQLRWTERWTYQGKPPNPVSIGAARKMLAAAFAEINCELDAAGVHGHAWMAETQEVWLRRDGTSVVIPPTKPKRPSVFTVQAQGAYIQRSNDFNRYYHLSQEGKAKLIEWFGKEMFMDLYVDGLLPTTKTPGDLIEHLQSTYASPRDHRKYMKMIHEEFNAKYDGKIENYFMKIQDASRNAELLDNPYSEQQKMTRALEEFENYHGSDAGKAETKWHDKPTTEKNWTNFKKYWKEEVHKFNSLGTNGRRQANQATVEQAEMASIIENLQALRVEQESMREANSALAQQLEFQRAFQASVGRSNGSQDDMSTITDYLSNFERRVSNQIASLSTNNQGSSGATGTPSSANDERLHAARNRDPKQYKNLNDGKGKQFSSYCWKCGCNCTHWTRKCFELSGTERKQYKDADFDNLMGGSTKFLDRRNKYQVDYGFDSL